MTSLTPAMERHIVETNRFFSPADRERIQMTSSYKNAVCRGSYALGTACGQCERCAEWQARSQLPEYRELLKIPDEGLNPVQLGQWEFHCVDDVFIKQMHLPKAGILVPQHQHRYDHNSLVAAGVIRVWKGDEWLGDFRAPTAIFIEKMTPHTFMSLEDETVVYCIHNVSRSGGAVDIVAENRLKGRPGG
jgi:hypothetical protein